MNSNSLTLTIPGKGGEHVRELGERALVCDLYGPEGSILYEEISAADSSEIRELLTLFRGYSGERYLELGAGSGRLTMPLVAAGFTVTALDLSAHMLGILKSKLEKAPRTIQERCRVVEADMANFQLDERFDGVVLGSTSVTLLDDEGRKRMLRQVEAHLDCEGVFVLTAPLFELSDKLIDQSHRVLCKSGRELEVFEHYVPGNEYRQTTVVPVDSDGGIVVVGTSRPRVFAFDAFIREVEEAGFAVKSTVPLPKVSDWMEEVMLILRGVTP